MTQFVVFILQSVYFTSFLSVEKAQILKNKEENKGSGKDWLGIWKKDFSFFITSNNFLTD